jgi:hypothetical protein
MITARTPGVRPGFPEMSAAGIVRLDKRKAVPTGPSSPPARCIFEIDLLLDR